LGTWTCAASTTSGRLLTDERSPSPPHSIFVKKPWHNKNYLEKCVIKKEIFLTFFHGKLNFCEKKKTRKKYYKNN